MFWLYIVSYRVESMELCEEPLSIPKSRLNVAISWYPTTPTYFFRKIIKIHIISHSNWIVIIKKFIASTAMLTNHNIRTFYVSDRWRFIYTVLLRNICIDTTCTVDTCKKWHLMHQKLKQTNKNVITMLCSERAFVLHWAVCNIVVRCFKLR